MESADDDDDALLGFLFLAQAAQNESSLARMAMRRKRRQRRKNRYRNSERAAEGSREGPGSGVPRAGLKAIYIREGSLGFYDFIRTHHNQELFEKHVHLSRSEFDRLHELVRKELDEPLNPRFEYTREQNSMRKRQRKLFRSDELLFCFLHVLRGSNEGGAGLTMLSPIYGVSVGTFCNYFAHAAWTVFYALKGVWIARVEWPDAEQREGMRGLVCGFPNAIGICDGTKVQTFRPKDPIVQESRYDGHHRIHCFAILVWVDVFGTFIRLDFTLSGSQHDRGIFNDTDPVREPQLYFGGSEHVIADTGFVGEGNVVCPFKKGVGDGFFYREKFNRDIRRQRVCNEWGIGLIKNRYRLFLGRWPFSPDLFPMCFETAAMISNWRWKRRGSTPVPLTRRLEIIAEEESNI